MIPTSGAEDFDVWDTGGGLPYGECYGDGIAWSQASAVQNTWYAISDSDMVSGELSGVTHDGSGKLTLVRGGVYLISYDAVFESSRANEHVSFGVDINASGTPDPSSHTQTETKFPNIEHCITHTCLLSVTAGQTLNVMIRTTDSGSPTLVVDDLHLVVYQIG